MVPVRTTRVVLQCIATARFGRSAYNQLCHCCTTCCRSTERCKAADQFACVLQNDKGLSGKLDVRSTLRAEHRGAMSLVAVFAYCYPANAWRYGRLCIPARPIGYPPQCGDRSYGAIGLTRGNGSARGVGWWCSGRRRPPHRPDSPSSDQQRIDGVCAKFAATMLGRREAFMRSRNICPVVSRVECRVALP